MQVVDYYASSLDKDFNLTENPIIIPSDIDGSLEQHWTPFKKGMKFRTAFLFMEHKTLLGDHMGGMPKGQEDTYKSLVDTLGCAIHEPVEGHPEAPTNSFAMVAECYHEPVPQGELIKSENCTVRRIYTSQNKKWEEPKFQITVPELVMYFFYILGLRKSGRPSPEEGEILRKLQGVNNEPSQNLAV